MHNKILNIESVDNQGTIIETLFHNSSSILKTSYNYTTEQLVVTFPRGNVFLYNKIPKEIYESFKTGKGYDSPGSFFNQKIAKGFIYIKKGSIANTDELNNLKMLVEDYKNGIM